MEGDALNTYTLNLQEEEQTIDSLQKLIRESYSNAVEHGFHNDEFNFGEKIALIHAELSEALEAKRENSQSTGKIGNFDHITEELADACIRIFDLAERMGLPLAPAIIAKQKYNRSRPYKHGKAF